MEQPQRRFSLQGGCVFSVIKNLDYWCKYKRIDSYNPFLELPVSLLERIFEKIQIYAVSLRTCHLRRLIVPQTRVISNRNYNWHKSVSIRNILIYSAAKCPYLRQLDLDNVKIYDSTLMDLLPKLRNLEKLALTRATNITDKSLNVIGDQLPNIKSLNLNGCTKVTDAGVDILCFGSEEVQMKRRCYQLEELDLTDTKVTVSGLQTALKYYQKLQYLLHEGTALAIGSMSIEESVQLPGCLKYVQVLMAEDMNLYTLQRCLIRSPNLTSVAIGIGVDIPSGIRSQLQGTTTINSLDFFTKPERIEGLKLFENNILPLLVAIGQNLETLKIIGFKHVNLDAIEELCPNLKELSISRAEDLYVTIDNNSFKGRDQPFPQLKDIYVSVPSCNMKPRSCRSLLSSPKLETVVLHDLDVLRDEILWEVRQTIVDPRWSVVYLKNCHCVTLPPIISLLTPITNSINIGWSDCYLMSNLHISEVQEMFRRYRPVGGVIYWNGHDVPRYFT